MFGYHVQIRAKFFNYIEIRNVFTKENMKDCSEREMYREIFNKFSVPTLIIDTEYKIVDMNKSALQIFRNREIEFNRTRCFEVSHASETPCWESKYNTCPARKTFESGETSQVIHKHQTEPNVTVHEVITTPIFGKQGDVEYVLEEYHSSVQELRGLITICSDCKKIKMEDGTWKTVEKYIRSHTAAELSHGYCEDCAKEFEEKLNLSHNKLE